MTKRAEIGDVVKTLRYLTGTIRKTVSGVAYARNGNAHNPTVYYRWDVCDAAGVVLGMCATLREAKEYAMESLLEQGRFDR